MEELTIASGKKYFEVNTEKMDFSSPTSRSTMLFRNIPKNSPNLNLWNELDYVIKSGNLNSADNILDKLQSNLVNPEEKSLWFDRGARTLFLKGDFLGSIKAMQQSLKSALEFSKK